jgi:hypothetical protein
MKTNQDTSEKQKPICTISRVNEPNLELMAKAFTDLYNKIRKSAKVESA